MNWKHKKFIVKKTLKENLYTRVRDIFVMEK